MNWWHVIVGALGVIGVAGQGLAEWGSWLVGLAFLLLLIEGFSTN